MLPRPRVHFTEMKSNLHTHTTWCDGKDAAEDVVRAAIGKGLQTLGFSSHASFPEVMPGVLKPSSAMDYVASMRGLAAKYADQIRILCGVEADYIPGITDPDRTRYAHMGLDYIIGSIHFVIAPDGGRVPVDHTPSLLEEGIRLHFGGSAEAFVRAYFRQQRDMLERYDFDIAGHLDLVRKFNVKHPYFDESAEWYREELAATTDVAAAAGKIVEVNTGAISRGWLDDVYPSPMFRKMLRERGVRFILNSDAHSADAVDCAFDRFAAAEDYLLVNFP